MSDPTHCDWIQEMEQQRCTTTINGLERYIDELRAAIVVEKLLRDKDVALAKTAIAILEEGEYQSWVMVTAAIEILKEIVGHE